MWRFTTLVLVMLLIVGLATPALALNDTPQEAATLTADNPSQAGQLVGDHGGAVRFYSIDYAGNAKPVQFAVTATPGCDTTDGYFGFKVYGPTGLVGEAGIDTNGGSWTKYTLTLASAVPGTYLVQVYNYSYGVVVDYTVQATGLGEATGPAAVAEATAPSSTTATSPLTFARAPSAIAGSILGQTEGAMNFFSLEYPGGTQLVVSMQYSPPSPWLNDAIGFDLYRGATLIGRSVETSRDGSSATVSFTLLDDTPGPILLQVHNYEAGFRANYELTISGAVGTPVTVSDNTTPGKAVVLTAAQAAARGSIGPGSEATFNYFLVTIPGGYKNVTFSIGVAAQGGIAEGMVGFNLFNVADMAGQVIASLNAAGDTWVGSITMSVADATTFGVQVFNYSTQAPASYSLYVVGLE